MSRIGKLPVVIPSGVTVEKGDGCFRVSGPKGELTVPLITGVNAKIGKDSVLFSVDKPECRALWGTARALLANATLGVSIGWERSLEMVGVGFKSVMNGRVLELNVGFSHQIKFAIPEGVDAVVDANTKIVISGVDKALVGQTAAKIRKVRPPEPYKGKGIRYVDEIVRRKAGKSGKAGAAAK